MFEFDTKENIILKWEKVNSDSYNIKRAKVPGGWLVKAGYGLMFYPDPEHQWDGGSLD